MNEGKAILLFDAVTGVREDYLAEAERLRRHPRRKLIGALAACFLLMVGFTAYCMTYGAPAFLGRFPIGPAWSAAEKPCLMVNGTVCYMGSYSVAELPEGYALAGTLEKVSGYPRTDLTGSCPDGSEIYTCETTPEAVYVRMPGKAAFTCFTTERLQYAWLRAKGALYLWGDDWIKTHPDPGNAALEAFRGKLPETAVLVGTIGSSVRDALPAEELQTNRPVFVGYSVYADGEREDVIYIARPGRREALIFLREAEG